MLRVDQSIISGEDINFNVTFEINNTKIHCQKSLFAAASPIFNNIFSGQSIKEYKYIKISTDDTNDHKIIKLDACITTFKTIHNYLHIGSIALDDAHIPSVYKLAKRLCFDKLWLECASILINKITIYNIGELCQLVDLAEPSAECLSGEDTNVHALRCREKVFGRALCSFVVDNANLIVCSQKGQVSARVYVDVHTRGDKTFCDGSLESLSSDWDLTEHVLRWIAHRSIIEKVDISSSVRKSCDTQNLWKTAVVTDELRLTVDESDLLQYSKEPDLPTPFRNMTTELNSTGSNNLSTFESYLAFSDSSQENPETCLLAKTDLGVGCTSIHLGKLVGRLVSLSVKRCQPATASISSISSRGSRESFQQRPSIQSASVLLPPSPTLSHSDGGPFSTPTSLEFQSNSSLNGSLSEGKMRTDCSLVCCMGPLEVTQLSVARTAAGASAIGADSILVAGGYARGGCLNSVEVIRALGPDSTESLVVESGPKMLSSRGRLSLVSGETGLVIACGGSDGTRDLASVECLSLESLSDWTIRYLCGEETPLPKTWRYLSRMHQARSFAAATSLVSFGGPSVVVVGGQFEGQSLSSVEAYDLTRDEWIALPSMLESRSQVCTGSVQEVKLLMAFGGIGTGLDCCLSTHNSTSLECFFDLPVASAEAYDLRCARWIRLPDLIHRSPLLGAATAPLPESPSRLMLIGGSDGQSALANVAIFDVRAWRWLNGPSLSIGRSNPCAVPLNHQSCVAVIGGYNIAAGGFLDSIECIRANLVTDDSSPVSTVGCDFTNPLDGVFLADYSP